MHSLLDAGAETIDILGEQAKAYSEIAQKSGISVVTATQLSPETEYLLVRADALVAGSLLAVLEPGEAICSEDGVIIAARVSVVSQVSAEQALQSARAKPWTRDRYCFAIHLSDESGFQAAKRTLLASMVKPSDGPVSRHFNRRISLAITEFLLPLRVTPNQVTVVVAVLGLSAAWLASFPTWSLQLSGALLYQLHSIVDGCDGEIARLTRRFGKYGSFIDSLVDDLSNMAVFVGLSIGVARALDASWPMATAAVTAACYASLAAIQYWKVKRATGYGDKTRFWAAEQRAVSKLTGLLNTALRRDVFVVLLLVAVAVGLAPVAVALFPIAAIGALVASVRQARQMFND
jgi:phosphatidylglycerophosphate synthase